MFALVSCGEARYVLDGVAENHRSDGRSRNETLPFTLNTTSAQSLVAHATTSLTLHQPATQTSITCSITADLVQPSPLQPDSGIIEVTLDCTALHLTSELFVAPKSLRDTHRITVASLLQQCVEQHLALAQLCVVPEQQCWKLNLDLVVRNSTMQTMQLVDLLSCALCAAMRRLALPALIVTRDGETQEQTIEIAEGAQPIPLQCDQLPLTITLTQCCMPHRHEADEERQYNSKTAANTFVIDATIQESQCSECLIFVGVDQYGDIVDWSTHGTMRAMQASCLRQLQSQARQAAQQRFKQLELELTKSHVGESSADDAEAAPNT